ncbi:ATP/GTP-binding protein [Streptomyces sp. 1222.5]|uniref:ATP/GTP-binding protein n=1 Tax=Streptomyces sp. 1222.5 TaxID=1881026 RepID=UPI003D70295D
MLSRASTTVAAAVVLAGTLAPLAHAAGGGSGVCKRATVYVQVCALDGGDTGGSHGSGGSDDGKGRPAGASSAGDSDAPKCTYEKVTPQPPPDNLAMRDGKKQGGKGAVYRVYCPDTGRFGVVWIPDGKTPAAPTIDPEVVARRAVDAMKLVGPKVASPRAAGKYVIGMPMWMWVDQTPTTYGPNTATATAGGVTVTATAKVSMVSWAMGDGTAPVICHGPGTKYQASFGKASSPDCGHVYDTVSRTADGGRFHGKATATWKVDWQVAGGAGGTGQFTEVRETAFTVDVREVQVLN